MCLISPLRVVGVFLESYPRIKSNQLYLQVDQTNTEQKVRKYNKNNTKKINTRVLSRLGDRKNCASKRIRAVHTYAAQ